MVNNFSIERRPNDRRRGWSQPAAAAELSISLIGQLSASSAGRPIHLKFRKAAALLGYLCMQDRMAVRRERLANLLWSEHDEQKARGSLRQIIALLRKELAVVGFAGLSADKHTVTLEPQGVSVDLLGILKDADRLEVHPLLLTQQRLPERILEGLEDLDDEYRTWLLPMRQALHNRLERSLGAGLSDPAVQAADKFKIATALLGLDPTNERACRYLMIAHANWGDITAAVRAFEQLSLTLINDHGLKPSHETQRLIEEIRRGAFELPSDSAVAQPHAPREIPERPHFFDRTDQPAIANPVRRTIALRLSEFEMHGVAVDRSYLVSGFRHELAACLVSFREWTVVDNRGAAPTALTPYAGAEYRLEGTAYQAGDAINMVLTLLDADGAAYVWSESFELRVDSWFATQQRLIHRLTSSLNVQLSAQRLRRISSEPDVSMEGYDKWLRAQALLATFRPADWDRARGLLSAAKQADAQFAPLYSTVVQMNNVETLVFPGILREVRKTEMAIAEAKLAVQLDPLDSRGHLCLGWAFAFAQRFEAAEIHMNHAIGLNPNDPWTPLSAALFWSFSGDTDRAQALLTAVMSNTLFFAPHEWGYCGLIRFLSEDFVGALEAFARAQDVTKTISALKAAAMAHLGRTDEALREGQRSLESTRAHWFGAEPASDSAIARWLLQAHPIGRYEHWQLLRDGLKWAGLPTSGINHRIW